MANPLFERFGAAPAQPSAPNHNAELLQQIRANPRAYVGELKANPAAFLRKCGYSIPEGMSDPRQIVGYLFGGRRG